MAATVSSFMIDSTAAVWDEAFASDRLIVTEVKADEDQGTVIVDTAKQDGPAIVPGHKEE